MSKAQVLRRGALVAAVGLAAACASSGVGVMTAHNPKTHERKIFLKQKASGGCTVRDRLSRIDAHKVDDIIWRVKNDCDKGTHTVAIRIKATSGDPLDSTCDRDVQVTETWERIFCAIGSQAKENVTYYYSIFVDSAEEQDPEIEIYP